MGGQNSSTGLSGKVSGHLHLRKITPFGQLEERSCGGLQDLPCLNLASQLILGLPSGDIDIQLSRTYIASLGAKKCPETQCGLTGIVITDERGVKHIARISVVNTILPSMSQRKLLR